MTVPTLPYKHKKVIPFCPSGLGMHLAKTRVIYRHDSTTFLRNARRATEDAPRHDLERGLPIEVAVQEIINITTVAVRANEQTGTA